MEQRSRGKYPYFEGKAYLSFLKTQCTIGGSKLLCQKNKPDLFDRFDRTQTCDTRRQTDMGLQLVPVLARVKTRSQSKG